MPDEGLVTTTCPKCLGIISTRNRFCVAICRCGWLLKVEPCWGTVSVDEVMDVKVSPITGKPDQKLIREAIFKVMENWKRRGLIKVTIDQLAGKYGIQLPTSADLLIEKEDIDGK